MSQLIAFQHPVGQVHKPARQPCPDSLAQTAQTAMAALEPVVDGAAVAAAEPAVPADAAGQTAELQAALTQLTAAR